MKAESEITESGRFKRDWVCDAHYACTGHSHVFGRCVGMSAIVDRNADK
jgi:hypothetical protein